MISIELLQLAAPVVVAIALLYLAARYWREYRLPAISLRDDLSVMAAKISELKHLPPDQRRGALTAVFDGAAARFLHGWDEYQETLHDQYENVDGELRIVRTRATVPSGHFFASQNMVETPLKTEYFKHLPGILTGIGIIGTFAGLLIGLHYFDASDPAKVQESVSLLLKGVRDAFLASASAIALAMYITNSEKKYLRVCYANLESLTEAIDKLFEAGVGEEYLASLVKSSEESARQARQLKDGLVTDLREMLQNLVDSQVRENLKLTETLGSVYRESGEALAASISHSIESSFREPLDKIAHSVEMASGDQSGQVQTLLQDVLMAFMAKLDSTFGQQFAGMHEMLSQSVTSMQQMQTGFQTLVNDMRKASEASSQAVQEQLGKTLADMSAGQNAMQVAINEMVANLQLAVAGIGEKGEEAGSRMAAQLEKLFAESEARQQQMASEMQSFVEALKQTVGKGQQETMDEIAATVGQLSGHLDAVMQSLESSRQGMDHAALEAQQKMQAGAQEMVADLGAHVQELVGSLQNQQAEASRTISDLSVATERSIQGMKEGAERMQLAAECFAEAGNSAAKLAEASGQSIQQLNASSGTVTTAVRELAVQVAEYRNHREAVQKVLGTLETVINNNQNEAEARHRMVTDLNQIAERMRVINGEASSYLDRVNEVLATSFDSFGAGVEKSLKKSLGSLDAELDKAIKSLAGGVEELNDNVEELSGALGKASVRFN